MKHSSCSTIGTGGGSYPVISSRTQLRSVPTHRGECFIVKPFKVGKGNRNYGCGGNGEVLNLPPCGRGNHKVLGIGIAHTNTGSGYRYPNDKIVRITGVNGHRVVEGCCAIGIKEFVGPFTTAGNDRGVGVVLQAFIVNSNRIVVALPGKDRNTGRIGNGKIVVGERGFRNIHLINKPRMSEISFVNKGNIDRIAGIG